MASTRVLSFPILAVFLLSSMYFSLTVSRPMLDLNTHQERHLSSADPSIDLDQQSHSSKLLSGNKPMPTESHMPSFLTFLSPVIYPLHFGRFRPPFPFPTIPNYPKFPPNHDDTNLPSKPSVPGSLDQVSPPPMPTIQGSSPIAKLP
ncbi:hypothetical protein DCAR_0104622 [Daucus carota subsp. sativus]|uniref:Uncharacterized protein n=1 Tax=Daucus carota subsp. sativus TaxID=79200 RepID=A0A166IZ06_DAUCS|nr:hypothetical protein DCAR_0104622 [Daucus carota subsp. sativus]